MSAPALKTTQRRWAIKLVTHGGGEPGDPRLAAESDGAIVTTQTRREARREAADWRWEERGRHQTATPVRVRVRTEVLS